MTSGVLRSTTALTQATWIAAPNDRCCSMPCANAGGRASRAPPIGSRNQIGLDAGHVREGLLCATVLGSDRLDQRSGSEDLHCPLQVVGQDVQAHLSSGARQGPKN